MDSIILASSSPRRRELLTQVGIPFRIIPSDVEENLDALTGSPEEKAEMLAFHKASDVAGRMESGLVLGADTMVVLDNVIFGKPRNRAEAYEMLDRLGGKTHLVITGIALIDAASHRAEVSHETTRVTFSRLTRERICSYLDTGEYEGKAGAYAIQGIGALFIEKIDGCYSNVVGLPLSRLDRLVKKFGVNFLQEG